MKIDAATIFYNVQCFGHKTEKYFGKLNSMFQIRFTGRGSRMQK